MEFQDKPIMCAECNQEFVFTAGEQEFYDRKGFKEVPKRCKPCRDARKVRRTNGAGNGVGRGERGSRQLYDATCAQCSMATQVPFRPTGDRPVYCRDCFAAQKAGGGGAQWQGE